VWQVGGLSCIHPPPRSFSHPHAREAQNGNYRFGERAIAANTAFEDILLRLNDCVCNAGFDSLEFTITAETGCCSGFQWCCDRKLIDDEPFEFKSEGTTR